MPHPALPTWAHALPGYDASRVLTDVALTPGIDEPAVLLIAFGWITGLTLAVTLLFRSTMRPPRMPRPVAGTAQYQASEDQDTEGALR